MGSHLMPVSKHYNTFTATRFCPFHMTKQYNELTPSNVFVKNNLKSEAKLP